MEKKKKNKLFFRILSILFFVYLALLIAYENGYYETKAKGRAVLTKEAMEQFENDLNEGQIVDVKDYLKDESVDYSNKVTKLGNKLSEGVSDIMSKGISGLFNTLKGWFW